MNILVVYVENIGTCPPVRNLVSVLSDLGHNVTLITRNKYDIKFEDSKKIKIVRLPENRYHGIFRMLNYMTRIAVLRRLFDREMKYNDILWTASDATVRELKGRILKQKHVMQLMELTEDIPEFPPLSFKKVGLKKYAQRACKVVVPEYNRAHIQKTWWELKSTPAVLPNKPVEDTIDEDDIPPEAQKIIDELKKEKRKIILYQGVFAMDRDLEMYAEALRPYSDKYCFCLLGKDNDYRKKICEHFPEVKYLGFLTPPYHLLVTALAYIALLPYVPVKCGHLSVLNALYCAPNKIYEYAKCGVPMIGNDVPGLVYPFTINHIGKIYYGRGSEEMKKLLDDIEGEYASMQENCHKFYEATDLYKIVEQILAE